MEKASKSEIENRKRETIRIIQEWMKDDCDYDAKVWPRVKKKLMKTVFRQDIVFVIKNSPKDNLLIESISTY